MAQIVFRAERTDGAPVLGQMTALAMDSITFRDKSGIEIRLPLENLISLTQQTRDRWQVPAAAGKSWVFLETGDRLCVEPTSIDETELTAEWNRFSALPPVRLPLEACRGVALTFPSDPVRQGLQTAALTGRSQTSDLVVLRNGDRLTGELLGLAENVVKIETSLGEVTPPMRLVQQIAFNPELVFVESPRDQIQTALLSDGSVLKFKAVSASSLTLTGTLIAGPSLTLPLEEVQQLSISGGRVLPLSQLPSARQSVDSFVTTRRLPQRNRNVLGGPLILRGRPALSGIGVASGTTLDWQLDGSWDVFQATVGIDDAARGRGSVRFEVLVDDRSAWRSAELTGLSRPVDVPPVKLTGAEKLTLRVEFAQQGNVLDYADWSNAVLIRQD
ncbi:MAG: NPCBM/NEW2 domain-containing protein [Planctomycetaceae bacterium]